MTIPDKQINAAQDAYRKHVSERGVEGSTEAMRAALEAADAAAWEPIETAPRDGTFVTIYAAPYEGLSGFITIAAYHPNAGWCVDELRYATHWRPIPASPKGE